MFKQFFAMVVFSVLIIFSMSYAQVAIQTLVTAHDWISHALTEVFSGGQVGNLLRGLLALLCIPFLVGLVPAALYYIVRRRFFPYFMQIAWIIWLLQAGALLTLFKAAGI